MTIECPKCGKTAAITKNGTIAKDRIRRAYRNQRMKLEQCPMSEAKHTPVKATLPQGCGYQGYEFGAQYPDSICFGGRLYDADNCDSQCNYYEPAEDIPCPMCHRVKAIDYWTRRNQLSGEKYAIARDAAVSLVDGIRKNRRNGTEPWKVNNEQPVNR